MFTKDKSFYKSFFASFTVLVLQNIIVLSVNLADNIMIGSYSETALAGVAAINQIQFVYNCLINGLGDATVVLGSQYWGRQKTDSVKKISVGALMCAVFAALILFLCASLFPSGMVRLFTDTDKIVLLLGFFDCLHKGHIKLIDKAKKTRGVKHCKIALFTFENYDFSKDGEVLLFDERIEKAERFGIDEIIVASFDETFKNTSPEDFFNRLISSLSIAAVVCGFDYTFGKNAEGNPELLKKLCAERGIELDIVPKTQSNGQKISTTLIKNLLSQGKIKEANELLGEEYSLCGSVVHGRQVGRTIGFPTVNINVPRGKFRIKSGVYKTHAIINGVRYDAITNYGARPTFGLEEVLTETYLKGFDGNLYGKTITIVFDDYIRDIVKFYDVCELKKQLEKDKNI